MSPRRRRGPRAGAGAGLPRAGPGPGRRSALRPRRLAWVAVAVAVVLIGASAWFFGRRPGRVPSTPGGPPPAGDAIALLDPETVFRTADSLGRAGRNFASLPYYRQALRNVRSDFWQLHFNYGTALYNATLEIEARNGLPVYAARSSWERVALMREAVQQILVAERLTRTPRDLALVRATRARMLWLWGLPWETFAAFRQAQAADPADRALGLQADRYMDLLHSPTTTGVVEPAAQAPAPR